VVAECDVDLVMVAGRWTLLDRSAEPLLRECRERGVAVVAAAPFNSGLLSQPWPQDGAFYDYARAPQHIIDRARAMAEACRRHGVELPHAALRFPLRHDSVRCVVAGPRSGGEAR